MAEDTASEAYRRNPVPAEYEAEMAAMRADHHARQVDKTASEARKTLGLLTEEEAAAVLLLNSPGTLATWRSQKTGPQSLKLGKRVFYTINQLGNWMNETATKQTPAPAAPTQSPVA
jgi:hypothetical protein